MNNEREAAIKAIEGKYGFPPSRLCMLFGRDIEWAFQAGAEWQRSQGAPAGYVRVPRELLERAAESIESEVDARYGKPVHPALERKYESDMVEVKEIRNLLAAAPSAPATVQGEAVADEREAFEAAVCERYGYTNGSIESRRSGDHYCDSSLSQAWALWQARAALAATSMTEVQEPKCQHGNWMEDEE